MVSVALRRRCRIDCSRRSPRPSAALNQLSPSLLPPSSPACDVHRVRGHHRQGQRPSVHPHLAGPRRHPRSSARTDRGRPLPQVPLPRAHVHRRRRGEGSHTTSPPLPQHPSFPLLRPPLPTPFISHLFMLALPLSVVSDQPQACGWWRWGAHRPVPGSVVCGGGLQSVWLHHQLQDQVHRRHPGHRRRRQPTPGTPLRPPLMPHPAVRPALHSLPFAVGS